MVRYGPMLVFVLLQATTISWAGDVQEDVSRFYQVRNAGQGLLIIQLHSPESTSQPLTKMLNHHVSYVKYEIPAIYIKWPGVSGHAHATLREEATSTVLSHFRGDSAAQSRTAVVRSREAFRAANGANNSGFQYAYQNLEGSEAALEALKKKYPSLPKPEGLYIDYREVATFCPIF